MDHTVSCRSALIRPIGSPTGCRHRPCSACVSRASTADSATLFFHTRPRMTINSWLRSSAVLSFTLAVAAEDVFAQGNGPQPAAPVAALASCTTTHLTSPLITTPQGHASAILRARRAAELRDSILRMPTEPVGIQLVSIPQDISDFLADPYTKDPISLDAMERCLSSVNDVLRRYRTRIMGPAGFKGEGPSEMSGMAGVVAGLAGGTPVGLALNLAEGTTDFLIERAKDEVAYAFVTNIASGTRGDRFVEAALPGSHLLMQQIGTETFQSLMPTLRSAFFEDLNNLPTRSTQIADALNIQGDGRLYLQGVALAYARGMEIRQGVAPAVALSNLVSVDRNQMTDPATRRALRVLGLFAREYAAGGGEEVIRELTRPEGGWTRRFFVAYVARDLVQLDPGTNAQEFMSLMQSRESDALLLLNQFHTASETVQAAAGSLRDAARGDTAAITKALAATGAVLGVLRVAPRFTFQPHLPTPPAAAKFDTFLADAAVLHQALTRRDFSAVTTWLLENTNLRLCEKDKGRCTQRLRYLTLASSLAAAQTSAEVTTALRTASAPVGSFRIKRAQRVSFFAPRTVSVIGYLGYGSFEQDASAEVPGSSRERYDGVALPFGLEFSAGMPWGALSLFLPVLDLGPLANQALELAPAQSEGEYDLENLLSPGVSIVANLTWGWPISVGYGIRSARRTFGEGDALRTERVAETLLFFGIDATLFNFKF